MVHLLLDSAGWNDKGGADYTEILARAAFLQGKLQSKNLTVSTGAQKVDYSNGSISEGLAEGAKPITAIDTAALGGMYAESIALVANEKGVGVKNAGTLEAAKQLVCYFFRQDRKQWVVLLLLMIVQKHHQRT